MWAEFIKAIIELIPKILEWLKPLFSRIEGELDALPADPVLAVNDACDAAEGELYLWQFAKKRQLKAFRRVALRHAEELAARAAGGAQPVVMSAKEHDACERA